MASITASEDDDWSTDEDDDLTSTLESSSPGTSDDEGEEHGIGADPFMALLTAGLPLTTSSTPNVKQTKNEMNTNAANVGLLAGKWPPRVADLFSNEESNSRLVKMVRALPMVESAASIQEHRAALIRMLEGRLDRGNVLVAREKLISFLIERRMSVESAATFVALIDVEGGGSRVDARIAIDQLSSKRFRLMPASFCEDIRFLAAVVGSSLLQPGEVDIYAPKVDNDDYAARLSTYMKGVLVPSHLLPGVLSRSDLNMRLAVLDFWLKRAESHSLVAVNGSTVAPASTQSSADLVHSLKVSSNAKDVTHLTDGRADTHWESCGSSSSGHDHHSVLIRLHPRALVSRLRVVVAADDASYMPERLEVLVGNHPSRITESVKVVIVPKRLTGELNIDLDLAKPYRFIRLVVLRCFDDGYDTRLRGLYVDGRLLPRQSSAEDQLASAFIGMFLDCMSGLVVAMPDVTREVFLTATESMLNELPPLFLLSNDHPSFITVAHLDRLRLALQNLADGVASGTVESTVRAQVCQIKLALVRGSLTDLIALADRYSLCDQESSNNVLDRLHDTFAKFDVSLHRLWMKAERRAVELPLVEVERTVSNASGEPPEGDVVLVVTLRLAIEEPFIPVRIKLRGAKSRLAIAFIDPDVDREADSGEWQRFRLKHRVVDSIRLTISVKRKLVGAVQFAVQGFVCRFASLAVDLGRSNRIADQLLVDAAQIQRVTAQLRQADHAQESPMSASRLEATFLLTKRSWEANRPPSVKRLLLELLSGAIVGCDNSQLAESIVAWLLALLDTEEDADMTEAVRRVVSDGCVYLYPDVVKRRRGFLELLQAENDRETKVDRPKAFLIDAFCKHFAKQDLLELPPVVGVFDDYEPVATVNAITVLIGQFYFLRNNSTTRANSAARLDLINSKLLQLNVWFRQMVANAKINRSAVAMERVCAVFIGSMISVFDALRVVLLTSAGSVEAQLFDSLNPTVLLMYAGALDLAATTATVNVEQLDDLIRSTRSLLQTVKGEAAAILAEMHDEPLASQVPELLAEWSVSLFDEAFAAIASQDHVFDLNGAEYFEIEFDDRCRLSGGKCLVVSTSYGTHASMTERVQGAHWPKTLRMRSKRTLYMSYRSSHLKNEPFADESNALGYGFKVRAFRCAHDEPSSATTTFYLTLTNTLALIASTGVVVGLQKSIEATAAVDPDVWKMFFAAGRPQLDPSDKDLCHALDQVANYGRPTASAGDSDDAPGRLLAFCSARYSRPMVGDGQIRACAYATFAALVWHSSDATVNAKRLLSEGDAALDGTMDGAMDGGGLVEAYKSAVALSHRLAAGRQQRVKAEGDGRPSEEAPPCVAVGDAIGRARVLLKYCSPALLPLDRIASRLIGFVVDAKLDAQTIEEMCILHEIRSSLAVSAYEIFEDALRVDRGHAFQLTFMQSFFHGNRSAMEANREIRRAEENVWTLMKANIPCADDPFERRLFLTWTTYMTHYAVSRDFWQIDQFDDGLLTIFVDHAAYQPTDEAEFLTPVEDGDLRPWWKEFYEFAARALSDPQLVDQMIDAAFEDGVSKKLAHAMRVAYHNRLPSASVDRPIRCAGCGQKEYFDGGCNRCVICANVSLCAACLVRGVTPPWPHDASHPIMSITHECDQCGGLIIGSRWSCITCRADALESVFDLCYGCRHMPTFPKLPTITADHDPSHHFQEIQPVMLYPPDAICALLAVHLKSLSRLLLTRLVVPGRAPAHLGEALLDRLRKWNANGNSSENWWDWLRLCALLFLTGTCRRELLGLIKEQLVNASQRTQIAMFGLFGRLAVSLGPADCDAVIGAEQKNLVTSSPFSSTVIFLYGFAEQTLKQHRSSDVTSALVAILHKLAADNDWRPFVTQYLLKKLTEDAEDEEMPFAALVAVGWPRSAFNGVPASLLTQHEEREMGVFLEYNANADRCLIIDGEKRKICSLSSSRATWPVNDEKADSAAFGDLVERLPTFLRYRMQAAMLNAVNASWDKFQLTGEMFEMAAKPTGFDIRASIEVLELAFNALLKIGSDRLGSLLKTVNVDDEVPTAEQDFDGGPTKLSGLHIALLHAIKSTVSKDADTDVSEVINNTVNHLFSLGGAGKVCLDEEIIIEAARFVIKHNCPPAKDRLKNADIADRGALHLNCVWELGDIPTTVTFLPEPTSADDQPPLALFDEPPERTLYKDAVAFRGSADKAKPPTMVAAELLLNEFHRLPTTVDVDSGFSLLRRKLESALSVLYCRKLVALALVKLPMDSLAKSDYPLDVSRLLALVDAIGMTVELRRHLPKLLDRLPFISLAYSTKVEGKCESAALKALMYGCCYIMDLARPRGPLLIYPSYTSMATIPEGAVVGGENQLLTLSPAVDFIRFELPKTNGDKEMPLVSVAPGTGPFARLDDFEKAEKTLIYGHQVRVQIIMGEWVKAHGVVTGCFDAGMRVLTGGVKLALAVLTARDLEETICKVWVLVVFLTLQSTGDRRLSLIALLSDLCSLVCDCADNRPDRTPLVDFGALAELWRAAHRVLSSVDSQARFGLKTELTRALAHLLADVQQMAERCGRQQELIEAVFPTDDERLRLIRSIGFGVHAVGAVGAAAGLPNAATNCVRHISAMTVPIASQDAVIHVDMTSDSTDSDNCLAELNGSLSDNWPL